MAPAACLRTISRAKRGRYSKAVSSSPMVRRRLSNRLSAAWGEAQPTKATTCVLGLGKSFSTAAVMIPSVPSEPTNRFFRS